MASIEIGEMMKTLRTERVHTRKELKKLDRVISALRELSSTNSTPTRNGKGRRMSAAARRKIAAAQRKRWAASRNQSGEASKVVPAAPARKKRKLSAAGKRRIIEATKRRWAAFHASARKTAKRQ